MKPKYLILGTVIALVVILLVMLTLKSGKTSKEIVPSSGPQTDLSQ